MDWIRLGKNNKDLAGTGGKILKVTPEELSKHNTVKDCWTAIRGKLDQPVPARISYSLPSPWSCIPLDEQ